MTKHCTYCLAPFIGSLFSSDYCSQDCADDAEAEPICERCGIPAWRMTDTSHAPFCPSCAAHQVTA